MLDAALADITHTPPLIGGPLFGVLFWWVTTALGYRLLRVMRVPLADLNVWERGLLAAAIGTGTIQAIPLLLATIGRLRPLEIRVAFLLLAVLLARDLLHVGRRVVATLGPPSVRNARPIEIVWWSLFVTFMGVWFVHNVTFGAFGDDDGIHLAAPKRWLAAGTLRYLPSYSLTNASMGFDTIYLMAMALWSPVGAKVLHYSAGLFALLGLVLAARRLASTSAGLLAISMMLVATPLADFPVLFGNAMIDLAACWMTMMTVILWLVWRDTGHFKLLLCMALCAGFAASFKLTSAQVAIAWAPILLAETRRRGGTWFEAIKTAAIFGTVAGLVVVPWFIRNLIVTGNPLYPMLTSVLPTRDWSPELGDVFGRYTRYYAWGVSAGSGLAESARKQLLLVAASLVFAAGAVAAGLWKSWIPRALISFVIVFTLISMALTGLIFRYWLPATMCIALLVGVLLDRRFSRWLVWAATVLLVLALAIQVRRGFYFHQPAGLAGDLRMATGMSTFEREYANDPIVSVWKFLNTETPADAQILFGAFYTTFGASSYAGFWVNRMCYTTDSHLQTYFRLDEWSAFKDSIARAQITHVVLSDRQFNPNRHGFRFVANTNEYPFLRRLVREEGERVYQIAYMEVYRLRQPTSPGLQSRTAMPRAH